MQTVISLAVAVVIIAFVTYRQSRWVPVRLGKMLRMPIIFVVVGVLEVPSSLKQLPAGWHLDTLDVVVIAVELVLALGVGWLMGRLAEIRIIDGILSSRLGRRGIAVWLGFIAVRVGLGFAAVAWSAPLAALPATIFFVVAVIKSTQLVVVRERVAANRSQPAGVGAFAQTVTSNQQG
jgi:hypothetical protein